MDAALFHPEPFGLELRGCRRPERAAMSDHRVDLAFDGPIARLTLKRADKLNALDRAMIVALARRRRAIEEARDVRVAILSGEGKAFCAGGDIAAWSGLPPLDMWRDWTRLGHRAFEALARLRVPLIAALTGHAFGGGLELAATADLRIAEARRSAWACPRPASAWRRDGRARSAWCAASARRRCAAWRSAARCSTPRRRCALGLVDEAVAPGQALARAEALAPTSQRAARSRCRSSRR